MVYQDNDKRGEEVDSKYEEYVLPDILPPTSSQHPTITATTAFANTAGESSEPL